MRDLAFLVTTAALAWGTTCALAGPALAAWPHDSWSNLPVCLEPGGDQVRPAIVADGVGGTIVAWVDGRAAGYGIYAQRLRPDGTPAWAGSGVPICIGSAADVQVVADYGGGAIFVWTDARAGYGNSDIYAQRVDSSGTALWTTNGVVVCDAADDQSSPAAISAAGGVLVAWEDGRGSSRDVYAQSIGPTGSPQWTSNGRPVCTASGDQTVPVIATDRVGGAIIAWQDERTAPSRIRAQRVNSSGAAQWASNGVEVSTSTAAQAHPAIWPDGLSGAILGWEEQGTGTVDIFGQRLDSDGMPAWSAGGVAVCTEATADQAGVQLFVYSGFASGHCYFVWRDGRGGTNRAYAQRVDGPTGMPQWASQGVAASSASGSQAQIHVAGDGDDGVIVSWVNTNGTAVDVYAQRYDASGNLAWSPAGIRVCTAEWAQRDPVLCPDGSGGAILAWDDIRNSSDFDIYAQRVDHFGKLGEAEPRVVSVQDVLGDQGGAVRVAWDASYLDTPTGLVSTYAIWRLAPGAADWESLATVPSSGFAAYSFAAPTTVDSTAGGNPLTSYRVVARNATGTNTWTSAPLGGYSVDNLAPPSPSPLVVTSAAGSATLRWSPSPAPDLAGYRLERSADATFPPAHTVLVTETTETAWVDDAPAAHYRVKAVDRHGNASAAAYASLTTGIGPPVVGPAEWSLGRPTPNPVRNRTEVRFSLPHAAAVSLAVFDVSGRRLRTLVAGLTLAGSHTASWDGRDGEGRLLPSALYLIRLEADGLALTRKVVWTH